MRFVASVRLALMVATDRPAPSFSWGRARNIPRLNTDGSSQARNSRMPLYRFAPSSKSILGKAVDPFAQALHERGCLWNTFVMIGRASAFLDLLKAAVPGVLQAFDGDPGLGTERRTPRSLRGTFHSKYCQSPPNVWRYFGSARLAGATWGHRSASCSPWHDPGSVQPGRSPFKMRTLKTWLRRLFLRNKRRSSSPIIGPAGPDYL